MSRRYVMGKKRREDDMSFADLGTAERWQHSRREMVLTERAGILAARALEECALDRWLAAGAITEDEHEAGLRLRTDYLRGQVTLRASRIYDGVRAPTPRASWTSPAERRDGASEAAYRHWREAIRATGQRASLVLIAVCCEDGALSWQRRSELRLALQALIRHYAH